MDTYGVIDLMLSEPYIFTGECLTVLRHFLNGYNFCLMQNDLYDQEPSYSLFPLPWEMFSAYVKGNIPQDFDDYDWYFPLIQYYGDQEGYRMFKHYYECFRTLEVRSFKKATLNDMNLKAYTDKQERLKELYTRDELLNEPRMVNYSKPSAAYLVRLSDGTFIAMIEDGFGVNIKPKFIKSEKEAMEFIDGYFSVGDEWYEVTGVSEMNFRKPVRLEKRYI